MELSSQLLTKSYLLHRNSSLQNTIQHHNSFWNAIKLSFSLTGVEWKPAW